MKSQAANVAVIAIHGVGDHQPFEMARSVADLLGNLEDPSSSELRDQRRYGAFREEVVRVHVSRVETPVETCSAVAAKEKAWGPFDARMKKYYAQAKNPHDAVSLDHQYMEGQLAGYKSQGPEDAYEFLRLEGTRIANAKVGRSDGPPSAEIGAKSVHVYDMFWSDLSGVGKGLPIFSELYQLLFHLGSVGVNNVLAARVSLMNLNPSVAFWWKWFDRTHTGVVAVLAWPIALLSLLLFALSLPIVAIGSLRHLRDYQEVLTIGSLAALALTSVIGYLSWKLKTMSRWPPLLGALLSLLLACLIPTTRLSSVGAWRESAEWVLALIASAIVGYLVWRMVLAYDRRRPGTKKAFYICAAVTLVAYALAWLVNYFFRTVTWWPANFAAATQLLRLMEAALMCLAISWVAFGALLWASCISGFVAGDDVAARAEKSETSRAFRTDWTARLTVALPSALFLIVTLAGFSGYVHLALPLFSSEDFLYQPSIGNSHNPVSVGEWTQSILFAMGIYYLAALLLAVVFAALLAAWAFVPSIISELSPPKGKPSSLEQDSRRMFNWLSSGFGLLRWGGEPIYWTMALFPPIIASIFIAVSFGWWQDTWEKPLRTVAVSLVTVLGSLVAGAGIGLLGFGGRLAKLALGFRPLVRVALDVDNWLREHPRDVNPTARISARYTSLLRYISQWQNENSDGYDALVIFAHSQGTVITSDLLRFLRTEQKQNADYDPALARLFTRLPVYLFTVGCPLRQLYGLRFPYLYGYASGDEDKNDPHPFKLGVRQWVNAYRSGDYIGRELWRKEPWKAISERISLSAWKPPVGLPPDFYHDHAHTRFEFSSGVITLRNFAKK